jgi:hypothetical protein
MTAQSGVILPVAPQSSPLKQVYGSVPHVMHEGVVVPPPVLPAPAAPPPATRSIEPLKLCELKDPKSFIDNWDLIQYYLCVPKFSTGCTDDSLVADSTNLEASRMWEGQLRLAVKDGSLCYLFKTMVTFITVVALKCWQCYLSIAALIHLQMHSSLSSLCTTMSRGMTSRFYNIGLVLTGSSWTCLDARLLFPRSCWLCSSCRPFIASTPIYWNSFAPASN